VKQPLQALFAAVAMVIALPHGAQAQVFLKGKIKSPFNDEPGPVVVIVDNPNGPTVWHTVSHSNGNYTLGPLPVGRYRVCVQGRDYDTIVKEIRIDPTTKPFSPRLQLHQKLRRQECPGIEKVFLSLTTDELRGAVVTLRKSGGTWETGYSIMISGDGRLSVLAPQFTPIASSGPLTGSSQLEATQVTHLLKQFYSLGFFSFSSPPAVLATDAQLTTLSFSAEGLVKSVEHLTGGGPKELAALEEEIESLANVHGTLHSGPRGETLFGGVEEDLRLPKPGMTPLLRAAGSGDLDSLKRLISEGQDPAAVDSSGWDALMIAAAEGRQEIVEFLVAGGANPNARSQRGETTLMAAAGGWSGYAFVLRTLLQAGADPNAENDEGQTALIWAARRARPSVIEALLAAHADVNHRTKDGLTALGLLRSDLGERSRECQELLRRAGATK